MSSPTTYPARRASISELERLSDKARELRLGQASNPRLWADAIRAVPHVGYGRHYLVDHTGTRRLPNAA